MKFVADKTFSEKGPSDKVQCTERATAVSSFVVQYARGELVSRHSQRARHPAMTVSARQPDSSDFASREAK